MKKTIALLLALVMLFALAACSGSGDKNTEPSTTPDTPASQAPSTEPSAEPSEEPKIEVDYDNPIKIGHIADLTGNEASTGTLAQKSIDFAAKLINEQGGINGRAIEIITKDSQSTPATAVAAVRELVENEGVIAIVGPTQIGHKVAVAPVAAEYEVPVICYNGTPAFLAMKNEYVMSSGGGTAQMPTAMADYLYNKLGLRTIYTITQEGTAGDNYVKPLIDNFTAMGGTVIEDIRVPADATDIGQYLLRVTKEADALVGWLSGTQGVTLWTTWYDQGLADKMPLYGAVHGGFTDYFIWLQLNKQRPEVVEKALEWGVYAPINYAYSIDNEANAAFVEEWKAENDGAVPVGSNLPGAGYTCLSLIKNAIESIDGDIDGASLYAALQNAEANVAEGHTAFNGQKIAAKAVYIAKVVKLDDGSFNYEIVDVYEDVPVNGLTVG
ncbi:MAG: ABC transporter substrate-binding protein [Oscillospiraceae bacterium]